MTLPWFLTGAALFAAIVALLRARRLSKRLERLTESYWELRYEVGQLRAQVGRLDPARPLPGGSDPRPEPSLDAGAAGGGTFVPLSSLKR